MAIFRLGRKLPVRAFLTGAVVMVMALSVAFVGNAVRQLQQAAILPVDFLESVPRLPIFLADLTGWHPTLQSIIAQAVLASVYVLGGLWVFVVMPARERGARRAEAQRRDAEQHTRPTGRPPALPAPEPERQGVGGG
jgi:high-affinity iron transporter